MFWTQGPSTMLKGVATCERASGKLIWIMTRTFILNTTIFFNNVPFWIIATWHDGVATTYLLIRKNKFTSMEYSNIYFCLFFPEIFAAMLISPCARDLFHLYLKTDELKGILRQVVGWYLPVLDLVWRMVTSSNGNIFRFTGPLWEPCGFPSQRPVTRTLDVIFDLRLNKRLSK